MYPFHAKIFLDHHYPWNLQYPKSVQLLTFRSAGLRMVAVSAKIFSGRKPATKRLLIQGRKPAANWSLILRAVNLPPYRKVFTVSQGQYWQKKKKTTNFCQQKLANKVGPSARRKALFYVFQKRKNCQLILLASQYCCWL